MAEHPAEGGDERPATMGQVKALARRVLRKREAPGEEFLNIYAMMDMMTIILVFLMATWATEYAEIQESAELAIPISTSMVEHQTALSVTITSAAILVEGVKVVDLQDGQVDAGVKQGGSTGFLILPLLTTVREHRELQRVIDQARGHEFAGDVQIIADRRTPYRTITEVLYTLGQAEYKNLRFVVKREGR
jgi:biopolymer transport protein ExbD